MIFFDIDILKIKFCMDEFEEYDNSIVRNDDVKCVKNKLIAIIKKEQSKLKNMCCDIIPISDITKIVKQDIVCFYLYELYTKDLLEEMIICFEDNIDYEEIVSLYSDAYLNDMKYPKILKIFR